jgi:hypothetical protein
VGVVGGGAEVTTEELTTLQGPAVMYLLPMEKGEHTPNGTLTTDPVHPVTVYFFQ